MKEIWSFLALNNLLAMGSAKGPLTRTIPMPLSPMGVEMAAIVSSPLAGFSIEGVNGEFLLKGCLFSPLFRLRNDRDSFQGPFPETLCPEGGVFFKRDMDDPAVVGIERADGHGMT